MMAPMLAIAEPLLHGVQRMPLPALNSAFDGLYGPGDQWYWRADFVNTIPDEAVALNEEWNEKMPSWKSGSHIYPIDGAAHDVGAADTPWAYRDAQLVSGDHRRRHRRASRLRRSATGRWATGTICTRTPPAVPTSTS